MNVLQQGNKQEPKYQCADKRENYWFFFSVALYPFGASIRVGDCILERAETPTIRTGRRIKKTIRRAVTRPVVKKPVFGGATPTGSWEELVVSMTGLAMASWV